MGRKFKDNALTTLASSLTALGQTLTVATGKGDNFPAVTGAGTPGSALDYFVVTLEDASGNREKIKVEARTAGADVLGSVGFPLVRGYDGTSARAWAAGDSVDLRLERAGVQESEDRTAQGNGHAFGNKPSTTAALNYGYYGGVVVSGGAFTTIADGTVAMTSSSTNYVERTAAGAVSANTSGFTAGRLPMAIVVTDGSKITSITDRRPVDSLAESIFVAKGDIIVASGAGAGARKAVGSNGLVLVADSAQSDGLSWGFHNHGQCFFYTINGAGSQRTKIKLIPHNGNRIIVNGKVYAIPSAGVTHDNNGNPLGLSTSTFYYVYLYDNAGTLTLELSTTGHETDSTTGVEVKSGDATRTLVGAVRTNGSGYYGQGRGSAQVYESSWFNRQKCMVSAATGTLSTSSGTAANIWNAALDFIILGHGTLDADSGGHGAGRAFTLHYTGIITNDGGPGNTTYCYPEYDGTNAIGGAIGGHDANPNYQMPVSINYGLYLSEGRHYISLLGYVNSSNGYWYNNRMDLEMLA